MAGSFSLALVGFPESESATFESFFRLAARRPPAYVVQDEVLDAQVLVVNADNAQAVHLVRHAELQGRVLLIGHTDAGTGILGIEAASRGASAVDFVERDGKARALLLKHLSAFAPDVSKGSTRLQVHGMDALNFTPLEPVDLLFLDPPYRQGLLDRVSPRLPLLIKPSGCLYVEAEHRLSNFGSWRVVKQGQSGQVFFHLLEQS